MAGRRLRPVALLLLATLLAGAAPLSPGLLPGVGPDDARRVVAADAAPWTALARLQVAGVVRCTAVVVAPDRVLTAAHCLYDHRMRRFVAADRVHVLARYAGGRYAAHVLGASWRILPGYDPARPDATRAADAALVILAAPLGAPALALAATPAAGAATMLGGYNQDRVEVIEADTGCRITAVGALLAHDCAATRGTSGAPLLVRDAAGGWRIAGIQTGAYAGRNGGVAVPAAALQALLATPESGR